MVSITFLHITSSTALEINDLNTCSITIYNTTELTHTITINTKLQSSSKETTDVQQVHDRKMINIKTSSEKIIINRLKLSDQNYRLLFQGQCPLTKNFIFIITHRDNQKYLPTSFNIIEEFKKDPMWYRILEIEAKRKKGYHLSGTPQEITTIAIKEKLESLYIKGQLNVTREMISPKLPTKIPRIIHQIWFGSPLPSHYQESAKQWKEKHPHWNYILWDEKKIEQEFKRTLICQQAYDESQKMKKYSWMSDIIRYEVLVRYGGLYIDCDVQCLQSFDELHFYYDFYGCLEPFCHGGAASSAIIGAKPNHPIPLKSLELINQNFLHPPQKQIKEFLNNKKLSFTDNQAFSIVGTGPRMFIKALLDASDKDGNKDIIFPPIFGYALANVPSGLTFCHHSYDGAWLKVEN